MFDSQECHTANATDLSKTRVLILVNKIYTMENKRLLGIYAVVNQVTLEHNEQLPALNKTQLLHCGNRQMTQIE